MKKNDLNPLDNAGNALVGVGRLYYSARDGLKGGPKVAEVELVFKDGTYSIVKLPFDKLSAAEITRLDPRLHIKKSCAAAFNDKLSEDAHEMDKRLRAGLLQPTKGQKAAAGIFFEESGLHHLPDGNWVCVWGDRVLGRCNLPTYVVQQRPLQICTAPIADPLPRLMAELAYAPPQAVLGVAYLVATLLRSWFREITSSWQAVLNIVGGQGLGKTTLALRLTGWIRDDDGDPALFFSADSTAAATRDAMTDARDLPVVIDDLCLSASKQLERKYRDLGAQFVREGANEAKITKKMPGGKSISLKCQAGVILTAEFALENASDITRCIFINVEQPLSLPTSLSSDLIGAACLSFVEWFLEHEPEARAQMQREHLKECDPNIPQRVWNNFTILKDVFHLLLNAAKTAGMSHEMAQQMLGKYNEAVEQSLLYQVQLLKKIDSVRKKGNIAAILLLGLENDDFHLAHNIEKLYKKEGIIWKSDLCLRREPLERFVRMQDGYHDYRITKIVQELKDLGALVLQEDHTAQVRLKKDTPRVYRIRLDVLRETAEEYI